MITTLYKISTKGKTQQWTIELKDDSYRTSSGYVDGEKSQTAWTVCKGKNVGRANATSPAQQAANEVQSAIKKKKDKGYVEKIENAGKAQYFEPMLAKEYESVTFPAYTQPKLDGIRCIVTKNAMNSRNGKPFYSFPHILNQMSEVFEEFPDFVFDGEIYNHDLKHNFNKISSLSRLQTPTAEELVESEQLVEYHVYDCFDPNRPTMLFSDRSAFVEYLHHRFLENTNIKLVETHEVKNQSELDKLYEKYLENGYEGQMIRVETHYENKRTKSLLKRKEWQDDEWVILDVEEGKGNKAGMAAKVYHEILKFNPDTDYKKYWNDTLQKYVWTSNVKGNWDFCRELFANKDSYIGKMGTVEFQNYTPDLIPRFAHIIKIRNYE